MSRKKEDFDFELSTTEEHILSVLLGVECYGLEIIKAVEEISEGKRKIGFGSLYPLLHKLEKRGLVQSRWGEEKPEERNGARRRYYRITGLGERALREAEQLRVNLVAWQPA